MFLKLKLFFNQSNLSIIHTCLCNLLNAISLNPYLYCCIVPMKKVDSGNIVPMLCIIATIYILIIFRKEDETPLKRWQRRDIQVIIKPFSKVWWIWFLSLLLQFAIFALFPKIFWTHRDVISFLLFFATLNADIYYVVVYLKTPGWSL